MLHFVTSHMKQNKSRKQTLESAQYGLEISFKRCRLRISRIDGQTRKIENPDNLPEEHLWGTFFENVIVIF